MNVRLGQVLVIPTKEHWGILRVVRIRKIFQESLNAKGEVQKKVIIELGLSYPEMDPFPVLHNYVAALKHLDPSAKVELNLKTPVSPPVPPEASPQQEG